MKGISCKWTHLVQGAHIPFQVQIQESVTALRLMTEHLSKKVLRCLDFKYDKQYVEDCLRELLLLGHYLWKVVAAAFRLVDPDDSHWGLC